MCPCSKRPDKISPCKQAALHAGCVVLALWQCAFVRWLALVTVITGMTALVLAVGGCKTHPVQLRTSLPAFDFTATLTGQEGKDRAIAEWAAKIDAATDAWLAQFPSPFANEIRAATAGQREEIRKAPASQFNAVVAAYQQRDKLRDAREKEDAKTIADIRADLAREKDRFFFWMRLILTGGGSLVMAASVAGFFFLGQLIAIFPSMGKRVLAGVGAFGATLFASGIAYAWAYHHQTLLACIAGAILIFVATGIYFNRLHDKAQNRLA